MSKVLFIEPAETLSYREMGGNGSPKALRELPGHFVLPKVEWTAWTPVTIPALEARPRAIETDNFLLKWYLMSLGHEAHRWRTPMYLHSDYTMEDLRHFSEPKRHQILGYVMTWGQPQLMGFKL